MRFAPNPGVLAAGVLVTPKTYAEFVAHIDGRANLGFRAWSFSDGLSAGGYTTTAAAATGTMYGTPWLSNMSVASTVCRIVQHGLPTEAAFNAQISGTRKIFFQISAGPSVASFSGLNRNGYSSLSIGGGPFSSNVCAELLYWDGTQAQKMNPSSGAGPTPYDW